MHEPDVNTTAYLVELSAEHPGFRDAAYRGRRDAIARLSSAWRRGDAVPGAPYTDDEHALWRAVVPALTPLHAARAGRAYHEACEAVRLPRDRIPQLADVNALLAS